MPLSRGPYVGIVRLPLLVLVIGDARVHGPSWRKSIFQVKALAAACRPRCPSLSAERDDIARLELAAVGGRHDGGGGRAATLTLRARRRSAGAVRDREAGVVLAGLGVGVVGFASDRGEPSPKVHAIVTSGPPGPAIPRWRRPHRQRRRSRGGIGRGGRHRGGSTGCSGSCGSCSPTRTCRESEYPGPRSRGHHPALVEVHDVTVGPSPFRRPARS